MLVRVKGFVEARTHSLLTLFLLQTVPWNNFHFLSTRTFTTLKISKKLERWLSVQKTKALLTKSTTSSLPQPPQPPFPSDPTFMFTKPSSGTSIFYLIKGSKNETFLLQFRTICSYLEILKPLETPGICNYSLPPFSKLPKSSKFSELNSPLNCLVRIKFIDKYP